MVRLVLLVPPELSDMGVTCCGSMIYRPRTYFFFTQIFFHYVPALALDTRFYAGYVAVRTQPGDYGKLKKRLRGTKVASIACKPTITAYLTIEMSENEAAALDALAKYGIDEFLKTFYEHLGRSALQPYESGLRSLFMSIRHGDTGIRQFLDKAKTARKVFLEVEKG